MAIKYNTSIVRSGLVLHLDAANAKSYKNYNLATYSQDFANAVWSKSTGLITASALLAPDGTYTATTLTDDDTVNYESFSRGFIVQNDSASYNISVFIKKTTGGTSSRTGFNVFLSEGSTTKPYNIRFNADTGVATGGDSNLVTSETNNYWRLSFTVSNNSTGNTALSINYYPATGVYNGSDVTTATGSHTVWGLQITRGAELLPYKTNVNDNTNIWSDLSGNGSSATLVNGVTYSTNNLGSFSFDGVDDYAEFSALQGNFTVGSLECWVKPTVPNTFFQIVSRTNNSVAAQFNILKEADNSYRFVIRVAGIQYNIYTTVSTTPTSWANLVATYDGATQRFYFNSVLQATVNSISGAVDTTVPYVQNIGRNTTGAGLANAQISAVGIYNRALTASEIQQNFEALRGRYGI